MHKLTQYRLCPLSRSIRLALLELGILFAMAEEKPWEWRPAFLALNPAGDLPVLELDGGPVLYGAYAISEYIDEEVRKHPADGGSAPLFPGNREERAEVRRLVDWWHGKLNREVTRDLLDEKVYRRFQQGREGPPEQDVLRAARANLRYHLKYISYLADQRRWLAGEQLSFADLAAAAHLASIDYVGEVPWQEHPAAKEWYARVKSRPSFQPLLGDRVPGLAPPAHYADLDF